MVRGLQSASTGMIAQMAGQDITANNLANANTAGYKRDIPSFESMLTNAVGAAPMTRISAGSGVDFAQGVLREAGNKFSMALEGEGFFNVQTPTGTAYTRDGAFNVSNDGYLVTESGNRVLGTAGAIKVGRGDFAVDPQGQITQNGAVVDTLKVSKFANTGPLSKTGGNLWTAGGAAATPATGTSVRQGYLEGSNVNSVSEMVSMITAFRTFEATQKSIQAQDETLDKCVNEVGRVG